MTLALLSLSFKSLASSATRWLFTLIAIILGVGGIVATLSINAALAASLDRTAHDLLGRADAELVARDEQGLSPAALDALRGVPQVALAVPRLTKLTYFEAAGTRGFLNLTGIDPVQDPVLHPMSLVAGQALDTGLNPDLLVPQAWATTAGLQVGDTIRLITTDGFQPYTIRGLLGGAESLALGGHPAVFITLDTMRQHFARGAHASQVSLQYRPGAAGAPAAIAAAVHEPYTLRDLAAAERELGSNQRDFRWLLALFGVIALVGGGVQILNTLAILAQGRSQELALLRAAGALPGQVVLLLVLDALIVGVIGSILGVVLGAVLAGVLSSVVQAGRGIPLQVGLDPGSAVLGLGAGIILSILAGLIPAWMVARREPLSLLRPEAVRPPTTRSVLLLAVTTAVLLALFAVVLWTLLGQGTGSGPEWLLGGFAGAVFIGLLLLLVAVMPILISLIGRLFRGTGAGLAVLAQQSLRRQRARTAVTVSALTIAVTLLTTLLVLVVSAASTGRNATRALFAAPWVLVAPVAQPAAIIPEIVRASGVSAVSPLRKVTLSWDGRYVDAVAVDPEFYRQDAAALPLVSGDRDAALTALAAGDAVLVPAELARRYHLAAGGTLNLWTPGAGPQPFTIAGILRRSFPAADPAGALVLAGRTLQKHYGLDDFTQLLVRPAAGESAGRVAAAAEQFGLQAQATDDLADDIGRTIGQTLLLFGALTATAALVGALSIVNAMSLNVLERTRVIGLLRAAGMTTAQVAQVVVLEAALLGLLAGVLGVVLGTGLGWLLFGTGRVSQDATFAPPAAILLLIPATALLTILASLTAARRAAITSPLTAVRHH